MNSPLSYKDAGVDIEAGDALVDRIKPLAKKTLRQGVLAGIGGFGAMFEVPAGYKQPVLVSGTDGVGTKLRLAINLARHDTVGIDLVAMSVNDILVQGAEPLYFLDYFGCGKLDVDTAEAVVSGIAEGCLQANCALIGGETAEMPGMYPDGDYDLAGFAVGIAEKAALIDGRSIEAGDRLLGLASSGAHSNGYSLIRRVVERSLGGLDPQRLAFDFDGRPFADALMAPTRIYVRPVLALVRTGVVKGLIHVTGGGLLENVPRMLPEGLQACIEGSSWPRPPLFDWLQREGAIDAQEMYRVFNCGIGMVVILAPGDAAAAAAQLREAGETVYEIGQVRATPPGQAPTVVV
ncbi:MAG: phosphoribosylformylglycinamidine cyclo-ligase [Burkholderiaceae bacterium]